LMAVALGMGFVLALSRKRAESYRRPSPRIGPVSMTAPQAIGI
jgi:hypothetical protein